MREWGLSRRNDLRGRVVRVVVSKRELLSGIVTIAGVLTFPRVSARVAACVGRIELPGRELPASINPD